MCSSRVGRLAGRIGQRPLLVTGAVLFAVSGLHRQVVLGGEDAYWRDYFPSKLVSGFAVALVMPQLSSGVARALPAARAGVGGATLQSVRQFGGTFGGSSHRRFPRARAGLADELVTFDSVWWLVAVTGIATAALALPMHTRSRGHRATVPDDAEPPATITPVTEDP